MKNLILQHFDGELRELDKLSMANIQEYADMVGADYRLITGRPLDKKTDWSLSKGLHDPSRV